MSSDPRPTLVIEEEVQHFPDVEYPNLICSWEEWMLMSIQAWKSFVNMMFNSESLSRDSLEMMRMLCPDLNWTLWCHLQFLTSWKTVQAISHLKANAHTRESRLKHCFEINACSISGIARTYFSKDWIAFISSLWWSPPQKPIAPCMADSKLVARLASRTRPSSILSTF